jgi:hypothetical protein
VTAVNVAEAPPVEPRQGEPRPRRLRDYLWLAAAAWLRDEAPVFCADDAQANQDLAGELASVKYGLDSDGCLVVEPKDAMKKRLGHSPDLADALCCTFAVGDWTLPAVNLASLLDLRQPSLLHRMQRPPQERRTAATRPEASGRDPDDVSQRVRRQWGLTRNDDGDY